MAEAWCVLRTSAGSTLGLAQSLSEAGFGAWTPVEVVRLRAREGARPDEITRPLMPSFVFADAGHLGELVAVAMSPSHRVWDAGLRRMVQRGHPSFSIFRHNGEYPVIPDRQLDPLRRAERRSRPKGKAVTFQPGQQVRLSEGGFAGLTGTVRRQQGQYAEVMFPGFPLSVKISTWLLQQALDEIQAVKVNREQAEQALHAKAA